MSIDIFVVTLAVSKNTDGRCTPTNRYPLPLLRKERVVKTVPFTTRPLWSSVLMVFFFDHTSSVAMWSCVRLANHRHQGTQHSVCSPCSRAHFGRVPHRMCVIAERLGCLHWLAHAPGHRHFSGASTSRRTASVVS